MKKRIWIIIFGGIFLLLAAFFLYTGQYYHADAAALDALKSDDTVHVTATNYGWFFDGPSETEALIFYPGAKVEETAYAPLLRLIASWGMDVCLIKLHEQDRNLPSDSDQHVIVGGNHAQPLPSGGQDHFLIQQLGVLIDRGRAHDVVDEPILSQQGTVQVRRDAVVGGADRLGDLLSGFF